MKFLEFDLNYIFYLCSSRRQQSRHDKIIKHKKWENQKTQEILILPFVQRRQQSNSAFSRFCRLLTSSGLIVHAAFRLVGKKAHSKHSKLASIRLLRSHYCTPDAAVSTKWERLAAYQVKSVGKRINWTWSFSHSERRRLNADGFVGLIEFWSLSQSETRHTWRVGCLSNKHGSNFCRHSIPLLLYKSKHLTGLTELCPY